MMIARRVALVAAAALALAACTEVTQKDIPADLVFATFASPNIPTPNDLALRAVPTLPASAQKEFLQTFVNAGGFPSDQEVTISIPFNAVSWDAAERVYVPADAPTIDPATVNPSTVTVLKVTATTATPVTFEVADVDPATAGVQTAPGVLTLRKTADATGSRRWDAGGRYVFAIRGGASGVKTTEGKQVSASSAVALSIPNRDLTKKENQPLGAIPDSNQSGTNEDEIALLENVRKALWSPVNWHRADPGVWSPDPTTPMQAPLQAVSSVWPVGETASVGAFNTAPSAGPVVLVDAGSGVVPLPIDLLRTDADGTVITNPSFGPAAAGLTTLDGFSTTGMMLASVSSAINAGTVHGGNVYLYSLAGGAATMVPEFKASAQGGAPQIGRYVAQPSRIVTPGGVGACPAAVTGGCSVAIGLQPAVKAPLPGVGNFYLPPLASNTMYAVVVTKRVLGADTTAMARPTVGKILLELTAEPASGTAGDTVGVSTLSGVSDATARSLRDMRANLAPVWGALPEGTTKDDVAFAYTFKTQTIQSTALSLTAAPYGIEQAAQTPIFAVTGSAGPIPGITIPGVSGVYRVTFRSFDGIDKTTGAFRPTLPAELNPAAWTAAAKPAPLDDANLAQLSALVAVPSTIAGSCPAGYPGGTVCAPLAVVGHGFNGSKTTMLAVAAELAAAGYIAVATDFPLHGDRNWCRTNADCDDGGVDGTCTAFTGGAGQGDAQPPGVCTVGTSKPGDSRYFVSANFFRIRDAFRQNLIDQSALIAALARALPAPQGLADVLPAGAFVDPRQVHYLGISLGSIAGTSVVATNPRITRASLDVGGGTFTDVAINSPRYKPLLEPTFATLIPGFTWDKVTAGATFDPAIAARFLQVVNLAKWILDPGDPINFADHVSNHPLPNLLANPDGSVPQSAKGAYGQISFGDNVVPNDQNELLYALMGATTTTYDSDRPAGEDTASANGTTYQVPYEAGSVPHGIIGALPPASETNPLVYIMAGAQVRGDAVDWLTGTTPPAETTLDLTP